MNTPKPMFFLLLALGATLAPGCDQEAPPADEYRYGTLTALADKYGTDKGSKGHRYTEVYEYFFLPVREEAKKIFEIGVLYGDSMKMFRDYFPNATIYGADIKDKSYLDSDRMKTIVADQAKRDQLQKLIDAHGSGYDIIIDDGGHTMEQQQVSFGYLFPHVKPGGYYIIEDVQTSLYGEEYGAQKGALNTTLDVFFNYVTNKRIVSEYMKSEEDAYATDNIDYCELHVGRDAQTIAWIIKKKATEKRTQPRRKK